MISRYKCSWKSSVSTRWKSQPSQEIPRAPTAPGWLLVQPWLNIHQTWHTTAPLTCSWASLPSTPCCEAIKINPSLPPSLDRQSTTESLHQTPKHAVKKALKAHRVLWGLWVSAHTLCRQWCLDRLSPTALHPSPEVSSPSHLAVLLQPFEQSLKTEGYFHPTAAAAGSPSSPGKPLVLTWKTQRRRPLPRVIFSTHCCDYHSHKVLIHAASVSRSCPRQSIQGCTTPQLSSLSFLQKNFYELQEQTKPLFAMPSWYYQLLLKILRNIKTSKGKITTK